MIFSIYIIYYLQLSDIYDTIIWLFLETKSQIQEKYSFIASFLTFSAIIRLYWTSFEPAHKFTPQKRKRPDFHNLNESQGVFTYTLPNNGTLYCYSLGWIEPVSQMLVLNRIIQLVADNSGVADNGVDIGMGMTINPYVYTTVCNEVAKFSRETRIEVRSQMPVSLKSIGRDKQWYLYEILFRWL